MQVHSLAFMFSQCLLKAPLQEYYTVSFPNDTTYFSINTTGTRKTFPGPITIGFEFPFFQYTYDSCYISDFVSLFSCKIVNCIGIHFVPR